MLEVFDKHGAIADNIDPAEVEALPDDQREILIGMLKVARAAEAADDYRIACRTAVTEGMRTHDAALADDHAKNPSQTHQDALLDVIYRNRQKDKPKQTRKLNKKVRDTLTLAITTLAEVRADLTRADNAFRIADRARSEAVQKWVSSQPKITQESVHREMCRVDQQRRQDIADGKIPAPVVVEPVHEWPIDQFFAARGKKTRTPRGVL